MSVTPLPIKSSRPREGGALQKGQQTKVAIVDAALGVVIGKRVRFVPKRDALAYVTG